MLDLTDQEKERIRLSWSKVIASPEMGAELFYGRLFETAPETRRLFKGDMVSQGQKLVDTINTVVDNLNHDLTAPVTQLGQRHQSYEVGAEDYDKVATALLWMLKTMVGAEFDKSTEEAWTKAYTQISATMLGAYS